MIVIDEGTKLPVWTLAVLYLGGRAAPRAARSSFVHDLRNQAATRS